MPKKGKAPDKERKLSTTSQKSIETVKTSQVSHFEELLRSSIRTIERNSEPFIKKQEREVLPKRSPSAALLNNVQVAPKQPIDLFPADDEDRIHVPRITIWKPFTKEFLKATMALPEGEITSLLEGILPKNYSALNKHFTKILLYDIFRWCQKQEFNDKKTSSIMGMYFNTHNYFLGSLWRNQRDVYYFFKESIILHTIQKPPKSKHIFELKECKAGLLYFCKVYLPMLPLLRVQLLPNYRLKLLWHLKEDNSV